MPHIKLENFSGIIPRTGPTQLPDNAAQIARNVRVTSLELQSWKEKVKVFQCTTPEVQSIYRLYNETTGQSRWLEWATDVNVVKGPIADDTDFRIYYTGDGAPKKTNWALATTSGAGTAPFPDAWLYMGVPAPATAPTLSATGGTAPTETRAYVYTYISTFGAVKEESAPSPAALVTCNSVGATVTVSGFAAAPTTGYNITHRRIYRTVTGGSTVSYQLVDEIPIATTTYNDDSTVAELGSLLQTQNWNTPPDGLKGLVSLPNGMMAGFRDNEIWFCEPYYPHAWPDLYTLTVDSGVVGLGVYDTTLVVMTKNQPYLITGNSPLSMSQAKLPLNQPCASKRSISSDEFGVVYASPNGLVALGPGMQNIASLPVYTREEWQELIPYTMLGTVYNNMYFGFSLKDGAIRGIVLSHGDIPPLVEFDFDATAVFIDRITGNLFGVSKLDNAIYQLDADSINNTFYEWLSKKFILPKPTNFAAFKVHADFDYITDGTAYAELVAELTALNQATYAATGGVVKGAFNEVTPNTFVLNGSLLQPIPPVATTRSINIFVYGDGQLLWSGGVFSPEPIRLPAEYKAYTWEFRLSGNTPMRTFTVSTSVSELKEVG